MYLIRDKCNPTFCIIKFSNFPKKNIRTLSISTAKRKITNVLMRTYITKSLLRS